VSNRHHFVNHLCSIVESGNRAALAELRRGLGKPPGSVAEMHRYVVPWFGESMHRNEQDAYYILAALFAQHPKNGDEMRSIGHTLRIAGAQSESMDGTERRFVAMLNAHEEELDGHLRHAVSLAKAKSVPINYSQLLMHLRHWTHPDQWVQRNWASDFWAAPSQTDENEKGNS